jgi:holo-[acyl-carrier protein] synthase
MQLVLRTGIDMVHVPRLATIWARYGRRFEQRIYTEREQIICAQRPHALAGRWAAKEAIAKLLGVGLQGLGSGVGAVAWQSIEVERDAQGKPLVILHALARQHFDALGLSVIEVSISHDGEYVVASATAVGVQHMSDRSTPAQ